ncbi:PspA-associated protein PspAA, partial [Escherichia coli]
MIVRISGEDQYRLPDADSERLNALDNQAVAAAEA